MKDKRVLTSPCGLDCFNCPLYEDNLTDEVAERMLTLYNVPKTAVACKGCRQQDGRHFHLPNGCATLDCVKAKGVEFCSDCDDFPCALLAPLADGADRYPHNMKVYNLSRIKQFGFDLWTEEAGEIRRKYFAHPFVAGKGQTD